MNREPDEFDLELELAGAELPEDRRRALARARELDPARDELRVLQGWWDHHRPPLRVPPRRRTWAWGLAAVAVAAAAILLVLGLPAEESTFRPRGSVAVDLWRVRDGAPIEPTEVVHPGDQIGLSLVLPEPRFVSVAALQEDGAVDVLVPGQRTTDRFELPGRIALDPYPGREWLVVFATERLPTDAELQTRVRGLLPSPGPGPDRWVVEVTRGRAPR